MYLLTTELYLFHLQTEMQMTWNNHQTRAQKQFFAFPQLVIVIIFPWMNRYFGATDTLDERLFWSTRHLA